MLLLLTAPLPAPTGRRPGAASTWSLPNSPWWRCAMRWGSVRSAYRNRARGPLHAGRGLDAPGRRPCPRRYLLHRRLTALAGAGRPRRRDRLSSGLCGLGGDAVVERALTRLPGGVGRATLAAMAALFLLGFVMDAFDIISSWCR